MSSSTSTDDAMSETIGGHGFSRWHIAEIRDALRHLGRRPRFKTRKPELWAALCSAIEDAELSDSACDRLALKYRVHSHTRRERILQSRNRRNRIAAAAQQAFDDDADSSGSSANSSTEQDFDCTICAETLGIDQRPERPESAVCAHENSACRACLAQSISAQLSYKSWDALSCPSCESRYGYDEIKAYADPAVFARYDTYLLQQSLSGAQFQRCRTDGCESGQMCFPEQDHYIICQDCHERTCITCDIPWHPGVSCKQVAERKAKSHNKEEKASGKYIAKKTKKCPECGTRGCKVSGCDHMTCKYNFGFFMAKQLKLTTSGAAKHPGPQCNHQYCWECLADYKIILADGNHRHHETCMHHASNLPDHPRETI